MHRYDDDQQKSSAILWLLVGWILLALCLIGSGAAWWVLR